MSLDASTLADVKSALASSPMATTVSLYIKTSGTFGSMQTVTAAVSTYKRSQGFGTPQRAQRIIQAIQVRPLSTPTGTVKMGDKVVYGGSNYIIVEINNTGIASWVCERSERLGVTRDESFRAEGGGS